MCGIYGVEILGSSKSGEPSVVRRTEFYREFGLQKNFVVIEDCDEYIFCLDTLKTVNGVCPVFRWSSGNTTEEK